MAEAKGKRAAADFVSKIVKDPKQPPNTILLRGYLGASSDEGYTRLYLDPQLSDYVEIPDDAILNTQDIPSSDQSPLGGTYVWIQRDAEVLHGKVGSDRLKARFLEGRIYQQYMKGAQFGGARAAPPDTLFCPPTQPPPCPQTLQCEQTKPPLCPPSIFDGPCRTDYRICPPPPPSNWLGCPPSVAQRDCDVISAFPWQCPSQIPWNCPTQFIPQCNQSALFPQCQPPTAQCTIGTVSPVCSPQTQTLQCQQSVLFPQCQPPTIQPPCQVGTVFPPQCRPVTLAGCPSAVDACPSAWGCGTWGGFPGGLGR